MKIVYSPLSGASGAQRLSYPIKALEQQHQIESQPLNTNNLDEQLQWADLVVLQCLMGPEQHQLIERIHAKGKKVIIDWDDDFSSLPNSLLRKLNYSQEEITKNWKKYLRSADLITVPTERLAKVVKSNSVGWLPDRLGERGYLTPVKALPNFLPKSEYSKSLAYSPYIDLSEIRILYSCSESHLEDFKYILPVLKRIGESNAHVRIFSHGGLDFTYHCPSYKGKASHIEKTPYQSYYDALRKVKPHIFIAPLRTTPHNACRSNLKYLQAGLLKCAFVGSNLEPYDNVSKDCGLKPSSRIGWWWTLRKLVKNSQSIAKLGFRAYLDVSKHLLENHVDDWYEAYSEALNGREESRKKGI